MKPGESTTIRITTMMHKGMEGPHLFEIGVRSNDSQEALKKLYVKGNFGS
ncbi:MAG: hypothetical protein Q8R28_23740 [Dehalococcoidia bacterium]|nr:hypothetical protein [Dehalococcoidia bacterium]